MTSTPRQGNVVENPHNLEEILHTSRMVRDAINRGQSLDALNTPPIYCYAPHTQEVRDLFRLIYVMTPLYSCSLASQIPDKGNPIFVYAVNHDLPVPQEFWDRLAAADALYLWIGDKA